MSNKQKSGKPWMSNIVNICTLLTLFFIMAQVFFARRAIIQSSEWEKAKVTIDNIEHFRERLKETALFGKTDALSFADRLWPDFTTTEGWNATDTLRKIYWLFFNDRPKYIEDIEKSIAILNAFAYPIIMGYANEIGSYESVQLEFNSYTNFIMPIAFNGYPKLGQHVKLLHRLWRVRHELSAIQSRTEYENDDQYIDDFRKYKNNLLCFEGTEITLASVEQYEKKLKKEMKKIQKEITAFALIFNSLIN